MPGVLRWWLGTLCGMALVVVGVGGTGGRRLGLADRRRMRCSMWP